MSALCLSAAVCRRASVRRAAQPTLARCWLTMVVTWLSSVAVVTVAALAGVAPSAAAPPMAAMVRISVVAKRFMVVLSGDMVAVHGLRPVRDRASQVRFGLWAGRAGTRSGVTGYAPEGGRPL